LSWSIDQPTVAAVDFARGKWLATTLAKLHRSIAIGWID
jgi:hypothetical protein